MPSIKFTESELEFLVGQYELELIEAEKYIGEIKNILKKLGVISKDISGKKEIKKKRGRGRPAKDSGFKISSFTEEKSAEPKAKKYSKPGRPKKRGPKKGSRRKVKPSLQPVEAKVPVAKAADVKPLAKKVPKQAKPVKLSAKRKKQKPLKPIREKSLPAKATAASKKVIPEKKTVPATKEQPEKKAKAVAKKASVKKAAIKKKASPKPKVTAVPGIEVKTAVPETSPVIVREDKPAEV